MIRVLLIGAVSFISTFTGILADADPGVPSLEFRITLSPAGSFEAKSNAVSGMAVISGNGYEASKITLPIASLKTGIALRDRHMAQKYFESEKFPVATLTQGKAQGGRFSAKLEVHGKSKDIEGTYSSKKAAGGAGDYIEAKFKTSLSTFEIEEPSYMGVGVEDDVEVTAKIPVRKAGP